MEKKITYVEAVTIAMEKATDLPEDVKTKLNELIAQLGKKSVSKKQMEKQENRNVVKMAIARTLQDNGDWMSIPSIMQTTPEITADHSAQGVASMLTSLKDEGAIIRKLEKNKVYFKIAD